MEEGKKWFESRTVWAGIVVLFATAAGAFGFELDVAAQGEITEYIMAVVTAVGALVAIVGRVKATKTIGE